MNESGIRFNLNAKVVCVLAGSFAGIVGVVAGLVAGHMVDRFISQSSSIKKTGHRNTSVKPKEEGMSLPQARMILDVDESAGPEEVRRVYRQLASGFHPDTGEALDPQRKKLLSEAFIRIRTAYERIMDK